MNEDMEKLCCTCKWYAEFEGVCTNGEAEYCADFTSPDDYCGLWEREKEHPTSAEVVQGYYNGYKYPTMIDVKFDDGTIINYTISEEKK